MKKLKKTMLLIPLLVIFFISFFNIKVSAFTEEEYKIKLTSLFDIWNNKNNGLQIKDLGLVDYNGDGITDIFFTLDDPLSNNSYILEFFDGETLEPYGTINAPKKLMETSTSNCISILEDNKQNRFLKVECIDDGAIINPSTPSYYTIKNSGLSYNLDYDWIEKKSTKINDAFIDLKINSSAEEAFLSILKLYNNKKIVIPLEISTTTSVNEEYKNVEIEIIMPTEIPQDKEILATILIEAPDNAIVNYSIDGLAPVHITPKLNEQFDLKINSLTLGQHSLKIIVEAGDKYKDLTKIFKITNINETTITSQNTNNTPSSTITLDDNNLEIIKPSLPAIDKNEPDETNSIISEELSEPSVTEEQKPPVKISILIIFIILFVLLFIFFLIKILL